MPRISLGDHALFYRLDDFTDPWNPGEAVLFHHGYSRNHTFWYAWVPAIGRHFRCVRFDMRGHGQSDALPPDLEPSLEQLAADTLEVMDALGIEKVHFVGESLAGVLGIWLGAHHADRLHSLVLLSTPVKVSEQGRADFAAGASSWAAAFDRLTPAEWARRTMSHRFDPETTPPGYLEWAIAESAKTPVDSLRKYARLIEGVDLTGGIPPVRCPTLQIIGGSKLAPPDQARFLQQCIPGSRLEVVAGARHLVGYAKSAECAERCLAFWRGLSE
jgi:3-oxoadipate enol-lactonase